MEILDFNFKDNDRSRNIPVRIYYPDATSPVKTMIFNPGYQGQEEFTKPDFVYAHLEHTWLANYFVNKNYTFITIQHDTAGDSDGLETINLDDIQHYAREHLFKRGVLNISFVLDQLKTELPEVNLDNFIIGGHSNGGDIAKYFVNEYSDYCNDIILFDARRCFLRPQKPIKLLMFEADDTSTDTKVIPDPENIPNSARSMIDWLIVKPKNAVHASYMDPYITEDLKQKVYKYLDIFLDI